jgi:class 3 adenylate cyclase/tetratricopeptide (TPR) repeat protein
MQCPHCGGDNSATNSYCEACGSPLGQECAGCGHVNRLGSRFCGNCSKPLSAAVPPSPSPDQLLRSLSTSGGERKHLTVLFADIRNSTGLIAALDPEQAMYRMQPVLAAMKEAVHRYDGVVNKVQGDGIMALFGAPRPHEDHAVRACLAALAMQDAVVRLGDTDLSIRVGLNTGEVVVQAVQNSLYQTYDAAGATVHLANRMEQMSDSGGILLTAATFDEAAQFIEATPLGARQVRGIPNAVEVFKLTGLKRAAASERFRSGPRLSPFSGRQHELAALESELTNVLQGKARVVGVVGEAGLGKSRLCFEFADACRRKGIRVLESRVLAHGRATPLQPVLELLRDAFGIRADQPAESSRRLVIDRLKSRGTFDDIMPVLLDFLGLTDPIHPVEKLDSAARKTKLLEFVRQLLQSRPRDEALLILVEDLHWVDPASEQFIDAMVDAVVGTSTLVLLNFRPGLTCPWMQRSHYRQINLAPLEDAEIAQLLHDLLGNDPSLALLSRNIAVRAQGNPFFLEELIHSLIERGDFDGERGAYYLKGGIDTIPLPPTVQAVLSARVDRLDNAPRQVLQTAAVIGLDVPVAVLQQVSGLSQMQLSQTLSQLRKAELLYEVPPSDRGVHAFRHPLVQEVAYRSLLTDRRRDLHGAVARAIEEHFRHRADETAALLAFHLEEAGEQLRAAEANARAAIWVGANDPSQALRTWKKVRTLLSAMPRDAKTDFLRMMACGQIVNFGWREGITPEEARDYFEEAKALAFASGDTRANALIHAGYGRILAAGGSADEYVAKIREAMAIAGGSTDASLSVTLNAVLCHALRLSGQMLEAFDVNTQALEHAHELRQFERQMLGFDIEPWLIAMRGQTLVTLGRGDEARPYLDRIIALDSAHVDVTHHVIPSFAYVELAFVNNDRLLAEQHAERAFTMAIKSGVPYLRVYAQASRALSRMVAGMLDEAVRDFLDALEFARRHRAGLENEARILADLANSYRLGGKFDLALSTAREAISIAELRHARLPECLARAVYAGALYMCAGDQQRAEAEQELKQAELLLQETGAEIYAPFIRDVRATFVGPDNYSSGSAVAG